MGLTITTYPMVCQSPLKSDVFVTIVISETVNPIENFQRKTFPNVVRYNPNGIKIRF